jgi:trimeric autotransporter adhesin
MRPERSAGSVLICAVLLCLAAVTLAESQTAPSPLVPRLVMFNGVVKDANGKPLSGDVGVTFALYREQEGGAALWIETQNVRPDGQGRYSVYLGAGKTGGLPQDLFVSGEARWLGVQPEGQAEQPRTLLLSVPYALKAGDAETIGGLPPSAFVLAATANTISPTSTTRATSSNAPPPASNVTTAGGTTNTIPLFSTATDIENSAITQTGSGSTAKIGIGTTTPSSTLDVKGGANVRGTLSLNATGAATATAGKNSQPENIVASSFSSTTNTAVNQNFQLKAEPTGNNTSSPSGTLNLLFGQGASAPAETGLKIANNGQITFVAGQTFPGTGNGTVTGVRAGTDLTGGGSSGNVTLNVDTTKVMTGVAAGTGLTGGGTGGVQTLNVDTTKVPQLNASNIFTGSQTVNGNLTSTGTVTGGTVNATSSYSIGGSITPFLSGSISNGNAFLGFAGNSATTGIDNVASGFGALQDNTTGGSNTAAGQNALVKNTTGSSNLADGSGALGNNTTGGNNTAVGGLALTNNATGSYNSGIGYGAGPDVNSPGLTNATAVGAFATVSKSNALVLGGTGANAVNVGIGTATPSSTLDVHGTGNFTGLITFAPGQTFPGTGTITGVTAGTDLLGGGSVGSVTLSVDTTKVVTGVIAGTDLTGGGSGGTQTLNLDTSKVPQLNTTNTFTADQNVNGTLTAFNVNAGAYYLGLQVFAYGNIPVTGDPNVYLGYAGGATSSDVSANTGVGPYALESNQGSDNTAVGDQALSGNTGIGNTAVGSNALKTNPNGFYNTAIGYRAGLAQGPPDLFSTTAVGAFAEADTSNAVVLGGVSGVNGATQNTNVGIGTTKPSYQLHVGNMGATPFFGYLRVDGPTTTGSGKPAISIGGNGDFQIDAPGVNSGRFVVNENGFVGISAPSPISPLTIGAGRGPGFADAWLTYSSRRWKSNIQTLPDALSKVEQLRGVSYDRKETGKHEIGVIAEEVGKVVPEVVTYEDNGKDALGVDYSRLTALLIEAIKQQQKQIRLQQTQLRQQQKQINIQQKRVSTQQFEIDRLRARNASFETRLTKVENPHQSDLGIASVSVPQHRH